MFKRRQFLSCVQPSRYLSSRRCSQLIAQPAQRLLSSWHGMKHRTDRLSGLWPKQIGANLFLHNPLFRMREFLCGFLRGFIFSTADATKQ